MTRLPPSDAPAPPLRFEVGAAVACCMGGGGEWQVGVVVEQWYSAPDFPAGCCAAYAVLLDEVSAGAAPPRTADGSLEEGTQLTIVPRDTPDCCVRAAGRIGGRQSLLEALRGFHVGGGRQSLLHVVAGGLDLRSLLRLERVSAVTTARVARGVRNSWAWISSPEGRDAVRTLARGLSCKSMRGDNGLPSGWWAVPRGSKHRDTLCWGWRTNLEQAVKRGDAEVVRMITTRTRA